MNHNLKRTSLFISVLIAFGLLLLVAFSFLAGYWFNDHSFLFSKSQYPLFDQAYRLLEQYGLSPLPEQSKIEYGLIRGLLQAYNDPHTVLVEPPQHELGRGLSRMRIAATACSLFQIHQPEMPGLGMVISWSGLIKLRYYRIPRETLFSPPCGVRAAQA
jgi:hypothetical protein